MTIICSSIWARMLNILSVQVLLVTFQTGTRDSLTKIQYIRRLNTQEIHYLCLAQQLRSEGLDKGLDPLETPTTNHEKNASQQPIFTSGRYGNQYTVNAVAFKMVKINIKYVIDRISFHGRVTWCPAHHKKLLSFVSWFQWISQMI